ncbi:MAG: helix-turn-helix domain-containing protein [Clostridia bacterium]|nr:helix-turn-helix domain-containing protein [Clostridia bacterium]
MTRVNLLLFLLIKVYALAYPMDADKHVIEIPYSGSSIIVDGQLNDWSSYYSVVFSDTLSILQSAPGREMMAFFDASYNYDKIWPPLSKNTVEVWICWDLTHLYFAFQVSDNHLFAQIEPIGKTPYIHLNDGIEIYFDAKADSDKKMDINDYQFLLDVAGNNLVFRGDRELMERDTLVAPKATGQNIFFEYLTTYSGTLNDSADDAGYQVELAIPFAAIGLKPSTGMAMKMDICCNDIDFLLGDESTYEEKSLRYWAFNWIGISDFGYPETWLAVRLVGEPGWLDTMSGSEMRRWLTIYLTAFILTLVVIVSLILRMRKIRRLPTRQEIPAPKIILIEKQEAANQSGLSANEIILKKASDFIAENYSENIHTENLASIIGVTIRKLQRVTQEELQTTPTNFIYLIKLNLAADYLKSRKGNISETAYEFGFSDPGYFSKLFKRHFGVSPAEYLEKNSR